MRHIVIAPLIFLFLFWANGSQALLIQPIVVHIDLPNSNREQVVVTNSSNTALPIEASMHKVIFFDQGQYDIDENNAEDFLLFPPAAILKPGQSQAFRFQWVGDEPLQSSSYFLRFFQPSLPQSEPALGSSTSTQQQSVSQTTAIKTDSEQSKSGIAIRIHYNALVHVSAHSQTPQLVLSVTSAGKALLQNIGNRFAYSDDFDFMTEDGTLLHDAIIDNHFIAPNTAVELQVPQRLSVGTYTAHYIKR